MTDTRALLQEAVRRSPVPVAVTDLVDAAVPLDAATYDAVLGAVAEALRNAGRHARQPDATVSLAWGAPGILELVVRNEGPPRRSLGRGPGFGIAHSIESPMRDIGGSARIDISPDSAQVVLSWAVTEAPAEESGRLEPLADILARLGALTRLPPVRLAILPMLLAQVYLGLTHPWAGEPLILNTMALLVGIGVTWGLLHRLERHHPSQVWLLAAALAISVATAGSVAWIGAESLSSFQSWQVGFASLPLALIAFHVSLPALAAVVLPLPLLLAAVVTVSGLPPWHAAGALNTAVLPLFAGATAAGLRTAISRAERRHRRLLRAAEVSAERAAHEAATRRHLGHVRAEILPWLSRVADGRVDLADPATARLARVRAWGARDDLYAPDFFDDDLRRAAAQFRFRGGRLVVRPGVGGATATTHTAALLAALLPHGSSEHTITVTRQGSGTRVVVHPGLAPDALREHPVAAGFEISGDRFATEFHPVAPTTGDSRGGYRP